MLAKLKSSLFLVLGLITSVAMMLFFKEKAKVADMKTAQAKEVADAAIMSKELSDKANAAVVAGVIRGREREEKIRNEPVRTDYFDNDGL